MGCSCPRKSESTAYTRSFIGPYFSGRLPLTMASEKFRIGRLILSSGTASIKLITEFKNISISKRQREGFGAARPSRQIHRVLTSFDNRVLHHCSQFTYDRLQFALEIVRARIQHWLGSMVSHEFLDVFQLANRDNQCDSHTSHRSISPELPAPFPKRQPRRNWLQANFPSTIIHQAYFVALTWNVSFHFFVRLSRIYRFIIQIACRVIWYKHKETSMKYTSRNIRSLRKAQELSRIDMSGRAKNSFVREEEKYLWGPSCWNNMHVRLRYRSIHCS